MDLLVKNMGNNVIIKEEYNENPFATYKMVYNVYKDNKCIKSFYDYRKAIDYVNEWN